MPITIEKKSSFACCSSKSTFFKLSEPISNKLLSYLTDNGFNELKHFTKMGLLYVENQNLILSGSIGSNKIQVKCKKRDCDQYLLEAENLINNYK